MNKFRKAKLYIEMAEAAYEAIIATARREARYNPSEYLDDDYDRDQGWENPEHLEQHLNDQGKELFKLAQDLADQIEGSL